MLVAVGPRAPSPSPMGGGETEFADLRAAWDALPEARQRQLDGLIVEHSIFRSRSQIGFADFNDEIYRQLPPVPQALVRHNPASGRTSLYLASHASHIVGWPVEEGRALIEELIAFATQPQFVYRHRWTGRRPRHLGQPLHNASRPPVRRHSASRAAPNHRCRTGPIPWSKKGWLVVQVLAPERSRLLPTRSI